MDWHPGIQEEKAHFASEFIALGRVRPAGDGSVVEGEERIVLRIEVNAFGSEADRFDSGERAGGGDVEAEERAGAIVTVGGLGVGGVSEDDGGAEGSREDAE